MAEVNDAIAIAHEAVRGDLAVAVLKPIGSHEAAVSPGRVEQLWIGAARHPDALGMVRAVAAGTERLFQRRMEVLVDQDAEWHQLRRATWDRKARWKSSAAAISHSRTVKSSAVSAISAGDGSSGSRSATIRVVMRVPMMRGRPL